MKQESNKSSLAVLQMVSGDNLFDNLQQADRLIEQAVGQGANLLLLPENFSMFSAKHYRQLAGQEKQEKVIRNFIASRAAEHQVWICAGTIPLLELSDGGSVDKGRVRASSLLFNDRGEQVARYDKIHLFNVSVDDAQGSYSEGDYMEPGAQPVFADTPFGRIGLSVCYDLRFPELYRYYAQQGVDLVFVPSAFTHVTGQAHWEILLRARAIENQMFIAGANQGGQNSPKRQTWGHSMIVDPWGEVLASWELGEGVAVAELDRARQSVLRRDFPALSHRVL